jgi:curli biogenesis system outer membrane secretion channel CsgG
MTIQQYGQDQISTLATQIKAGGMAGGGSQGNSDNDYAIEDLEYNLIKSKKYTVVDRQQLEKIRSEQDFQLSGEVSDDSAVDIGKMAGATIVITISINRTDSSGRLTLKALDVQTAQIIAMARAEF